MICWLVAFVCKHLENKVYVSCSQNTAQVKLRLKKKKQSPSVYLAARDEYFETSRLQKILRKGGDYGPVVICCKH